MQKLTNRFHYNWKDWLFVMAISIVPYLNSTGLFPRTISIFGPNVQSIVLLTPLLLTMRRRTKEKPFYYILSIITLVYVGYKFATSCMAYGFVESFTNFRYSFLGIVSFFMAVIYVHSLPYKRLVGIFRLLIILTCIQAVLFIAHAIGILNLYTGNVTTMTESSIKVIRIYMGYPIMLAAVFASVVMLYILSHKKKYIYIAALLLITVFLSYTRSSLGELIIIASILLVLATIKSFIKLTFTFKLLITGLVLLTFTYILFPSSFSFWESKINTTRNEMRNEEGTYAFREKLIETAFYLVSQENHEWDGFGYKRDSEKGEYSFVQGGDTLIPPIIYCEGLIGFILRISIVIIVLLEGIRLFFTSKSKMSTAIASIIIAILLAQCVNYLQTSVYTHFLNLLLPLIILLRINIQYNKINYLTELNE